MEERCKRGVRSSFPICPWRNPTKEDFPRGAPSTKREIPEGLPEATWKAAWNQVPASIGAWLRGTVQVRALIAGEVGLGLGSTPALSNRRKVSSCPSIARRIRFLRGSVEERSKRTPIPRVLGLYQALSAKVDPKAELPWTIGIKGFLREAPKINFPKSFPIFFLPPFRLGAKTLVSKAPSRRRSLPSG
jgi:hypothetical protein